MLKDQRLLVVSAHSADWVWRCGGTIAKYLQAGAEVHVVCLTYGARGESGPLWRKEGQTADGVKAARLEETTNAAKAIGLKNIEMWDFDDCMLQVSPEICQKLNEKIREVQPTVILTHEKVDLTNPDHGYARAVVDAAAIMARQAGIESNGLKPAKACPIYGFEVSETERSGYVPAIYINITDYFDIKMEAMKCIASQVEGPNIHTRLNTHRGWQAARTVGAKDIKFAESFTMSDALVAEELPVSKVQTF